MISSPEHRFSTILEETDYSKRVPSQAQQEASRRNGAKSLGPATPAGKHKSAKNALTHGLLARRFTPPHDQRGDDVLFRRIRRELIEKYAPDSLIDSLTVDGLAVDVLQLTRARAMNESLQRPASLPPKEMEWWQRGCDARRDAKLLQRLLDQLRAGAALRCSARTADRLAGRIAEHIGETKRYLFPMRKDEVIPFEEMSAADQDEHRVVKGKYVRIRPWEKALRDCHQVARVLRGRETLSAGARDCFCAVLADLVDGLRKCVFDFESLDQQLAALQDQKLLDLAQAPGGLLLLSRYTSRLEHAVARKQRALSKR